MLVDNCLGEEAGLAPMDHAVRAYARQRSLRQHIPIAARPRHGSGASTPTDGGASHSELDPAVGSLRSHSGSYAYVRTGSLRLRDPMSGGFSWRGR